MIEKEVTESLAESDEEPPKFWKSWRRFYAIQLIYWLVIVILLIIGTRILNQ